MSDHASGHRNDQETEGRAKSLPQSGLPQSGLSQAELPQAELSQSGLSRRDFLKTGVAVGAAGAFAFGVSGLAGCTPGNAAPNTSDQETSEGADPEASGTVEDVPVGTLEAGTFLGRGSEPIIPEGVPATWDYTADVVVVGLGGGGLAATLKATEAGVKVIALEKAAHSGGNTKESTTFAVVGGSKVHEAAGAPPYDPKAFAEMMASTVHNSADLPLITVLAEQGPKFIDWLGDLGVPWEIEPILPNDGLCWQGATDDGFIPRATMLVTDFAYEKALEAGAEFHFDATVVNLIKEGERIVGVKVRAQDDSEYYVQGTAAVILTAGGMMNNMDMLKIYCPTVANRCLASMSGTTDTGEVIRMGMGAGAQMAGWDSYFSFDGAMHWDAWSHYLYAGDVQLIRQPWLGINIEGTRYHYFDDRDLELGARTLFFQSMVLQAQPGYKGYVIFDDDYETNAPKFGQTFCRKLITPDMANIDRMPESIGPHDWRDGAKAAIENGTIKKADSLEELAELLGFNNEVLAKAVNNWNDICEQGADTELGFPPEWLIPIEKAPFYGAAIGSYPMATSCGLRVDPQMRVISTEGVPIPGLYAGGMTAGGTNGESCYGYGCSPLGCNALTWVMGYIAAREALNVD
ncbi:MAG: FAD-binding protein [Coriobacteriales bacterium]|jgi:fumarate reductase flavoprotein subunit|nr:FAD-binding protein [Coriobacteriales bacterium]